MMKRHAVVLIVTVWALLGNGPRVLGWGTGHDVMNELAVEVLPAEISDILGETGRRDLVRYSHVPDDFTPWDKYAEKKGTELHPDDRSLLDRYGLKHPYAFHSHKGQAVNAVLVTRSMISRDPARMAFWMACLLHTMGDEAACNHDPLIHYITYAFKGGYGMKFGSGGVVDFGQLAKCPESMAVARSLLKESLERQPAADTGLDLVDLMTYGYSANAFMTQRGGRIAKSQTGEATDADIADAHRALSELAVYGITNALTVFQQCRRSAAAGILPEVSDEMVKEAETRNRDFLAERPLTNDALYEDLLKNSATDGAAAGIVVEVSQSMNKGFLSFGGKLIMPALARVLSDMAVPFRAIDLRELAVTVPRIEQFPVIAVCTGGFHLGPARENLKKYREAGGRLLMIGGTHGDCLGNFSATFLPAPEDLLPVSKKYGCNNQAIIDKLQVRFMGEFADALGEEPYRFIHNPDTRDGWQKPVCTFQIAAGKTAGVSPLATLVLDDRSCEVAAAFHTPDGTTTAVFLPEYLVAPYVLSDNPPFTDPSHPRLDSVGRALIGKSMVLLAPSLMPR